MVCSMRVHTRQTCRDYKAAGPTPGRGVSHQLSASLLPVAALPAQYTAALWTRDAADVQAAVAAARQAQAAKQSALRTGAALSYHSSTSELASSSQAQQPAAPAAADPAQPEHSQAAALPVHPMFVKRDGYASQGGVAGAASESHGAAGPDTAGGGQPAALQGAGKAAQGAAAGGAGAAAAAKGGEKKPSSTEFIGKLRRDLPPAVFGKVRAPVMIVSLIHGMRCSVCRYYGPQQQQQV